MPTAALPRPKRTTRVGLHPAQYAFRHSPALYRGFVGGRGSGKSFVAAYDLICRAKPGRLYTMVSPTYTILADTDFRAFCALASRLGVLADKKASPPAVTLSNGAEILFRSADAPDRLRGPNLSGVTLNEASLMHRDVYEIAIATLRQHGEQGWLSACFTPKGYGHWTYEVFGKSPPRPDTELFRAHTRDNPFNPPGFADTLALQYGVQLGRQELAGEFVTLEGAEWPADYFEHAAFWFDDWPEHLAVKVLSLDPSKGTDSRKGDFSAFVKLGVTADGTEYVEADLRRDRDGMQIVHDGLRHVREFRPDRLACETNTFQQLFEFLFQREGQAQATGFLWEPVENYAPKICRIRGLTRPLAMKKVRFKRGSPGTELLVQQLRDFPNAENDDGPDAYEIARRVALKLWGG